MRKNLFLFIADSNWNIDRHGEKRNRKMYSQNVKCSGKQNSEGAESYNKVWFSTMPNFLIILHFVGSFSGLCSWFLHVEAILDSTKKHGYGYGTQTHDFLKN